MRILIILFFALLILSSCESNLPSAKVIVTPPSLPLVEYDSSDALLSFRVDTFFEKRYKAKQFNGVALLAKEGKIVYHKAFGYTNFRQKKPLDKLDKNDAFQLASVSKPITAIAILQLVEQQKINLDSVVQRYIPTFPYKGITIRHLLSHRSGLANYMYFVDRIWKDKFQSISNDSMIALMCRTLPTPYYSPNVRYHYCNTNYALLATIVERVTGESYEDYLQKNIFKPAEMEQSFVYNKCKMSKLPKPVMGHNTRYALKQNTYLNGVVGDKNIYASALDLYKLDKKLHELVSDSLLQVAYSSHNPQLTERSKDDYGLGWRLQHELDFGKVVYHSGWWKGFKTYYIRMLDKKSTIIVLTNVTKGGYLNKMTLQHLLFPIEGL